MICRRCELILRRNKMKGSKKSIVELIAKIIFLVCAVVAIAAVLSITVYMIIKGTPALERVGVTDLLFKTVWAPAPQILHGLQGYLPLRRSDLYPSQPRQGLGPLHRLRTVRFRLPQRLHCAFTRAGAAGYRRSGFRQRYHLDRL